MGKGAGQEIVAGTLLVRADDILQAEVDGEVVMLSIERGEYYGLDEIGSEIWAMLSEPCSAASLCQALLERYDVEPEVCERDVLAFLRALAADGSVRVVERAGESRSDLET